MGLLCSAKVYEWIVNGSWPESIELWVSSRPEVGHVKFVRADVAAHAGIGSAELRLATFEARFRKLQTLVADMEHHEDCARTEDCEHVEYDSKMRYHCTFHGEDQCPDCTCVLGQLQQTVRL